MDSNMGFPLWMIPIIVFSSIALIIFVGVVVYFVRISRKVAGSGGVSDGGRKVAGSDGVSGDRVSYIGGRGVAYIGSYGGGGGHCGGGGGYSGGGGGFSGGGGGFSGGDCGGGGGCGGC
uniref:Uncharacterized protein n=1 Tax=Acrobeloides nanus TaxID=290746 RepID=A0A914CMV0_9BILA